VGEEFEVGGFVALLLSNSSHHQNGKTEEIQDEPKVRGAGTKSRDFESDSPGRPHKEHP
jgi:hypothetical protein